MGTQKPRSSKNRTKQGPTPKREVQRSRVHKPSRVQAFFAHPVVVGCVLLAGALLFGLIALGEADFQEVMARPGLPTTEAEIVGILEEYRYYATELTFTTLDGEEVTTETESFQWDPVVGDVHSVKYDPDDPYYYVQDATMERDNFLTFLTGGFAVLFAVGALAGFFQKLLSWIPNK